MRKYYVFFVTLCLMAFSMTLFGQQRFSFDDFFLDKTMRIDYYHIGDRNTEIITIDQIYESGPWAGSKNNLIDPFNNGKYYIKIFDESGENLIYSRGFNSYFGEYQTTSAAGKGIKRTYHESALIPFPKQKIKFTVQVRDANNKPGDVFSTVIDPNAIGIIKTNADPDVKIFNVLNNGPAGNKVDLAIIAEGYTADQTEKVKQDLEHFSSVFFELQPYKKHKSDFNIYGVFKPSAQAGCDEPTHNVYKNTSAGATFNSLGSPRYLLTEDNKSLRDIAGHVPYDAILIMVNHKRYGGGGIYNFYLTFTTDNNWRDYVFIHEFGHSFTGLADEYYSSATAYESFYPEGLEPVEANITALTEPENLKWKSLVAEDTPVPTPWNKETYDAIDREYQQRRQELNAKIAQLIRDNAPQTEIDRAEQQAADLSKSTAEKLDALLRNDQYWNRVGAFEGAGYMSEGLYRPMLDCIMFSKGKKPFCRVCRQAIENMIKYYTE